MKQKGKETKEKHQPRRKESCVKHPGAVASADICGFKCRVNVCVCTLKGGKRTQGAAAAKSFRHSFDTGQKSLDAILKCLTTDLMENEGERGGRIDFQDQMEMQMRGGGEDRKKDTERSAQCLLKTCSDRVKHTPESW